MLKYDGLELENFANIAFKLISETVRDRAIITMEHL